MSDTVTTTPVAPDGELAAKLTTALGRIDAGSAGGYEFRRHVARVDLLPLVKALLADQARDAHELGRREALEQAELAVLRYRDEPKTIADVMTRSVHGELSRAARLIREIGDPKA